MEQCDKVCGEIVNKIKNELVSTKFETQTIIKCLETIIEEAEVWLEGLKSDLE